MNVRRRVFSDRNAPVPLPHADGGRQLGTFRNGAIRQGLLRADSNHAGFWFFPDLRAIPLMPAVGLDGDVGLTGASFGWLATGGHGLVQAR